MDSEVENTKESLRGQKQCPPTASVTWGAGTMEFITLDLCGTSRGLEEQVFWSEVQRLTPSRCLDVHRQKNNGQ